MPLYHYIVKDKFAKTIKGKLTQKDQFEAVKKLREMDYTIINISEKAPSIFSFDIGRKFTKIKLMDKVTFYIKLTSMLKAGIPLSSSIEVIKEQLNNRRLRKIIGDVHRNILAGNSLSQSMSLYPNVFTELLINMVQSGEATGKLVEVLEQYAAFSENQAILRQKIVSALIYPFILIIAAIVLISIFLTYLLPRFVDLFKKSNIPLPLPTQMLVKIEVFLKNNFTPIVAVFILISISLSVITKFSLGRKFIDFIKLHLFYAGNLIKKISIARFTRMLGTLYSSGVPIIRSLEICENSTGNSIFAHAIRSIKERIIKGESFTDAMKDNKLFPADTVQIIAIGESSGNLTFMLYKIADFYERDADIAFKNVSSLIEPMIILVIGLVVGLLAYSIIIPIFDMMKTL